MAHSVSKWVGVDGCRAGWLSIGFDDVGDYEMLIFATFKQLVAHYEEAELILVDIPIGLPSKPGGRVCDFEARGLLRAPRASSVFPVPVRQAIEHLQTHPTEINEARGINQQLGRQRLSQQTWAIAPKIAEVDALLVERGPSVHPVIQEVHPELLFWAFNGCQSMANSKRENAGFHERLDVLDSIDRRSRPITGSARQEFRGQGLAADDVLDALVAALTADLCHDHLRSIPDNPQNDARGLQMEMVFCDCEQHE